MKTLNIVILVALIGVFTVLCIQNVYAIPYMSPQDLYKQSDMVFHGQVISKQAGPGPNYYYYQIKVDTFFKNPQTSDSITAAGHKPVDGRMEYPQFEIGDKAIFYTSKVDGVNTIGLFSQKAGMACDAQSFLGSAYLPNNAQSFSAVASNPRITDINGNAVVGKVQREQPIQITYDEIWNNYPEYRTIRLHMSIQNMVDTKPSFEENRTIFLNACDGPSPAKLNFVPEKNGTYIFSLNIDGKLTTSTSFDVGDSSYSVAMMTQSPLKQLQSGTKAEDVICKSNFQLMINHRTGNVACVKPQTGQILVERGWAKEVSQTLLHTTPIVSSTPCDIAYPQSNTGVAVLYMSTNSTGKICATYHNPDSPTQSSVRVFATKDVQQMASEITTSAYPDIVPTGNSTIVYDIKTGSQAGLYDMSFFCGSIPFAVGYDNQSGIILDDFPWLYKNDICLSQTNVFQITGLSGIHVKYVTVVHRG